MQPAPEPKQGAAAENPPREGQSASPCSLPAAARLVIDVIDDDPSVLRALDRLIRSHGSVARTFGSGAEFFNSPASREPDCLILDVQMSGMSGLDVQARLRALGRNVPIIFITAHEDPQAKQLALSRGAVAFFPKPFPNQTLWTAICSSLHRPPPGP